MLNKIKCLPEDKISLNMQGAAKVRSILPFFAFLSRSEARSTEKFCDQKFSRGFEGILETRFGRFCRTAHKAEAIQALIAENCPDHISVDISPQRANGDWPPNSPDLNAMDYSIWSILEEKACSKPHKSIEALEKSLTKGRMRSRWRLSEKRLTISRSDAEVHRCERWPF